MKERFIKFWANHPKIKKVIGVVLIVIGFISIITPFTPVGFLLIIGMELVGIRFLFWEKIKNYFKK